MINPIFSRLADVLAWEVKDKSLSPLDFIALEGKPSLLFAYVALLNPNLEQVDGRFFLGNGFDRNLIDAWASKGVEGADAQRVLNHIHMSYLMQEDTEDNEALDAAARAIVQVWKKTLPTEVIIEVVEPGTSRVAVTFFQSP